jgi:integrase
MPIDEITPPAVRRWYAGQVRSGLARTTVAKQYRLLRSILSTAVDEDLISRNPCQIRGGGIERSHERRIPSLDVVRELSAALPAHLAVVPWLAALGGLRKGEILALARRHVDPEASTISVERALIEVPGTGSVMAEPKTAAGVRTVAMPRTLANLVEAHLDRHVGPEPEGLLFTNSLGNPIRASVWSPAWEKARQKAGVDVRLHDL